MDDDVYRHLLEQYRSKQRIRDYDYSSKIPYGSDLYKSFLCDLKFEEFQKRVDQLVESRLKQTEVETPFEEIVHNVSTFNPRNQCSIKNHLGLNYENQKEFRSEDGTKLNKTKHVSDPIDIDIGVEVEVEAQHLILNGSVTSRYTFWPYPRRCQPKKSTSLSHSCSMKKINLRLTKPHTTWRQSGSG
ncbi:hypothetical protein PVK06_043084 [Gossypium arboreum]|uniref:Uncharacterized protein n=1 Tax=Gossypium arboreum TaxID=29729 RepID=A0ABR0MMK8_GOSAR|nr:hypothetical protein PVK06_043084 [Gossypium arboreum]